MRGGKDPNAVDLTPKLPDRARPRTPERHVVATRGRPDGGEEPDDGRDSTGEARARRRGPKNRRSTPQEAKATHTGAAANFKNFDDETDRKKPVMTQTGRVRADENPTTADLPQKRRNPKKDQKDPNIGCVTIITGTEGIQKNKSPEIQKWKNKNNTTTEQRWGRGWESPVPARVDHVPA
jgi:hypothetical protein